MYQIEAVHLDLAICEPRFWEAFDLRRHSPPLPLSPFPFMASWATVAATAAVPTPQSHETPANAKTSLLVVDANALISGTATWQTMAERILSTPEVLNEVRDASSRALLDTLSYKIETRTPPESSINAIRAFANATGDIYSISGPDLRLLALCHAVECERYGTEHLRTRPVRHTKRGGRIHQGKIPGWDETIGDEGEWAEVEAAEADSSEVMDAESRIRHAGSLAGGTGSGSGTGDGTDSSANQINQVTNKCKIGEGERSLSVAAADRSSQPTTTDDGLDHGEEDEEQEDDNSDEWVGVKSQRARRRQQRKTMRKQLALVDDLEAMERERRAREIGWGASWGEDENKKDKKGQKEEEQDNKRNTTGQEEDPWKDEDESDASSWTSADEGDDEGDDPATTRSSESPHDALPPHPNGRGESSVGLLTADFAMQNVALQMGLRVVAVSGLRIKELSQYVLRCHACFSVVRDMSRLFCPKCGNRSLDKVQVRVDENGTEHIGTRRRHFLRGTQFSLPAPRGGRAGATNNPILREDDRRLLRLAHRAKKKAARQALREGGAFDPEYTYADNWFAAGGGEAAQGLEALVSSWKNNPNERKQTRSNRRRK